jgi:hypothetical protein
MTEIKPNISVASYISLFQMMTGYWNAQAIYVVAKLGIADLLTSGPRSVEELASASNAHASSLRRLLRALASTGVFTETLPDIFALTPIAELLRTDNPESMRAAAIMYNEEQYRAWGELLHSIQTGAPAFVHHFGADYFSFLRGHPESNHTFNEAMTGLDSQYVGAVVNAYDFTPFQTIIDVGGGHGALLKAILQRNSAAFVPSSLACCGRAKRGTWLISPRLGGCCPPHFYQHMRQPNTQCLPSLRGCIIR